MILKGYIFEPLTSMGNINKRKIVSVSVTCVIAWLFSYLATNVLQTYALGLFTSLPFFIGAVSTMLYGYKNAVSEKQLRVTAFLTLLVFCLGLLAYAWEGVICILMSAPIALLFTWIGYIIGEAILNRMSRNVPGALTMLLFAVPTFMAFEESRGEDDDVRSVVTSININASPEIVWKNVVAFPQLKEPTEFIFRTGIAYPTNATISGSGVGAVRRCNFTTGCFVEPITVWDEPRRLAFSVEDQPEPMKELSPYDIHPNHLHGYWLSKQGQFKLTPLPNGHTLLEGTTWYVNRIKPDMYWTMWSDHIVHKIHERVLRHIKENSEKS